MKKNMWKKITITCLVLTIIIVSVLAILFGMKSTYSAYTKVIVPQGQEVTVYVSGNGVKKIEDENSGTYYIADPNEKITVTVVNESKLFTGMTINGTNYSSPIVEDYEVPQSGDLVIEVSTAEPYAEDKGKYFGNPYVLNKEADVLAVSRILADTATEADYELLGVENGAANDIRYGYFRLGTNLFISNDEFFGLGFRGKLPFGGCFDFNGFTVTLNLVRTNHIIDEFSYDGTKHVADYGFFSFVYGDGTNPCLIRNAKVQGFIGLNTIDSAEPYDHIDRINAGGVAGTLGKGVILDRIESSVSVSAQTKFAELYLGGVFGVCSSSVDAWCDVRYDGAFNDVSGVTYKNGASVIAGSFAGVLHNASVSGVTIDGERSMVLANALGDVSGMAVAGGFVGVIELGATSTMGLSEPRPMVIKDITIYAENDFSIVAVINNSASANKSDIDPDDYSSGSAAAVAGGIAGIVNRGKKGTTLSDDKTIRFSTINFLRTSSSYEEDAIGAETSNRLMIKASTQDGSSSGAVFAGGVVGYVYSHGGDYVTREIPADVETKYFFDCSVDISAVQNGVGPAYAGGAFGYNAFKIVESDADKTLKVGIVSPQYDYTVTAYQSATSTKAGNTYYNVCAGGYSSRFNVGIDIGKAIFYIGNGRITAYREVGSTAIGDINAGGLAGRILGCGTAKSTINDYDSIGTQSGTCDNVTVYYSANSRVEASCYSYDSINTTDYYGNNVCAGGVFGYVLAYNSISNLSLIYENDTSLAGRAAEYFVCGTQNASNNGIRNDNDLKTQGYVGGMFGLVIDTRIENINLDGDKTENSVVYFNSSNSPNTASVGGLIGCLFGREMNKVTLSDGFILNGASVKNVHTAGKAYCDKNNDQKIYDIYVGGAIGVLGIEKQYNKGLSITNISVDNCVVDAIGEKTMLTYAGGVVAGMWWHNTTNLSYAVVTDSVITASSIAPYAYAGGIAGLIQKSNISYCLTKDTEVKATSENSNAYAGGMVGKIKDSAKISYAYSNASLKAQGKNSTSSFKYGIAADMTDAQSKYSVGDSVTSDSKNFFVYESAGTALAFPSDSSGTRSLYLAAGYQNKLSIKEGTSEGVFSAITAAQSTVMSVKSYDKSIVSVNGLSVQGVKAGLTYVGAYCKIKDTEYLLCSYPVTVNNTSENGNGLNLVTDDGKNVSDQTCDAYSEYTYTDGDISTKYIYFRRNIGNPNTVKKVNVVPVNAEFLPQDIRFYDITGVKKAEYFSDSTTEADIKSRIAAIIAAKGTTCDVSAFNGKANVGFNYVQGEEGDAKKSAYFYANDNVRENTIILFECEYGENTYGVIIEFVPNKLTGITITPESGTLPLGTYVDDESITHYIYSVGDVVRFGSTLTYYYAAPRSYVVETIYSGDNVTENGVVEINSTGTYEVVCKALKDDIDTKVIIEAKQEVNFSFAFLGADVTFERKMVEDNDFMFSVSPQPGYGLNPVITATVNGKTADATFTAEGLELSFGSDTFIFSCVRSENEEYAYEFTANIDFVDYVKQNGNSVTFSVTYKKTYSLVFISNFNGNDFFYTTVSAGEKFGAVNPDGFEKWKADLIASRYGYDFRGFYTLSNAGDVSAYGKSFEDMQKDGVSVVSGTMRFYARWTYNVTVECPENVKVSSTMSASMIYDELIPLDANNGFGFVIEKNDAWVGKPRFEAYICYNGGIFENITSEFVVANVQDGYEISSDILNKYKSGHIYIKIFADSLEFNVGDDPKYDGNALYTDGIFTVTYNVNYGTNDKPKDFSFDFADMQLPKDTSLRLFYQKNGETIWAGSYKLTASLNSVSVAAFSSLKDGSLFSTDALRKNAISETFIMVVTLPNNTNGFGIGEAEKVTVSVDSYVFNSEFYYWGSYSESLNNTITPDTGDNRAEQEFVLYPAVIRGVTITESSIIFTESGAVNSDVADHRHNGVRYMWRIEKTDGGYIGDVSFDWLGNKIVETTDAVYYLATVGSLNIEGELHGYTLSLIEVKNIQQPAESFVIFSYSFD